MTTKNFETCISEKSTDLDIESHRKLFADVITCIGQIEKRVQFEWRDDEYDKTIAETEKTY